MKIALVTLILALTVFSVSAQIDNDYLKIGEKAPKIIGIDQFNQEINSEIILQNSNILLLFYRGNWCPYCKKHLLSLQENLEKLNSKGIFVIVVTPEKVEKIKETSKDWKSSFSIIHDVENKIMNNYKVAFEVNNENVPKYLDFTKNKIREYNVENNNMLPVPATYAIGKDGKIFFVHYDPDYSKRASFESILELFHRG